METLVGNCGHPEDGIIAGFIFYFVNKSKYLETCAFSAADSMKSYAVNYQSALLYVKSLCENIDLHT